jgi:Uma2 family endonuclease
MSTDTEVVTKKLFTTDEYHRMSELGILRDDRRFELIRGEIIEMPRPGPPHSGRVNRLNRLFTSRLGDAVVVAIQNPVWLDEFSEPLPDVALLKPRADFYTDSHPAVGETLLLIEVSDSTENYDRKIKGPLYAEMGIPEYWQLDVKKDVLVVHTQPADGQYQSITTFKRGQTIRLQKLPAIAFSIDEILG